jgi:hypothetical protein
MIDAPVVLRGFLAAQTPVSTMTGSRIWEERLYPAKGYVPAHGPAICFRSRGGRLDYSRALLTSSWIFKCYGQDEGEANALYRALVDVLDDAKTGGMDSALLEIAGQTFQEPLLDWTYVQCFFTTIMQAQFVPA